MRNVYADFGFTDIAGQAGAAPESASVTTPSGTRPSTLREALRVSGLEWEELPGEGAFYGPKIEFHIKDAIGRSWQCGTMQVDFSMPARLGAEYVAEDNTRKTPVMLHRAMLVRWSASSAS